MMFLIGMLAMALAFGMAGCNYFDLGEPMPEGYETQPKAGVLKVIGAEDGISYEAEVYDYPDDDIADAADLADLMSVFEMAGTGLDMPGKEALEIELLTPDGEDFTADGDFLVVLKDETDAGAPLRYKGAVPFIGGCATIEYDEMETVTVEPSVSIYTVTFDLNYTGAPNPPKPQEIGGGGKVTQPAVPVRTGYIFGGWFLNAAGTGAAWDFSINTVKGDITLYGTWTRNSYTVTFSLNGAPGTAPAHPAVLHGGKIMLPSRPSPTREGYTLDGWYRNPDGTGAEWNFVTDTVTENIILYAKWTQIKYAVTFNTGEGGSIVPALEVPYGSAATSPANPTRSDYGFDDWYAANAEAPYDFNSPVTADLDLLAKWKPRTFAAAIVYMAETANSTSASYTLQSGSETYTAAITPLTTANSPASVTIDGGNRVVTGSANRFTIGSGGTITLKNITFKTLPLSVSEGGKLVLDNGAVVTENAGTGVHVSGGTLEMRDGAYVRDNTGGTTEVLYGVKAGGGVYVNGGEVKMSGGSISNNYATYGGGVTIGGNNSTFTMTGGAITENSAFNGGGGVFICGNNAVFTMSGGSISENIVWYIGGGGLHTAGGQNITFNMSGTAVISDNKTDYFGGGLRIDGNTTFNMSGGRITGNTAGVDGGGVHIMESVAVFNMTGGEISGNYSDNGGGVSIWLSGKFNMSGGVIKDNWVEFSGGGVVTRAASIFNMTGGEIKNNKSDRGGTGGLHLDSGTLTGNPWIGANKASGAGPGWIYNNPTGDVSPAQ
jgi:uncharacterized repeat protein (TIGR02543 family)